MADQFLSPLAAILTGLGYTVKSATEPNKRDWDSLPLVCLAPLQQDVDWIAFGGYSARQAFKNQISQYEITLVEANDLSTVPSADQAAFQQNMINACMGVGTTMAAAGAWNQWLTFQPDYNRKLLPEGYRYTACVVHVAWVQN